MKDIEVVAAIIEHDGKIFATQRGYGEFAGSWEFPGGKIEPNESQEQALVREIHEELNASIIIERYLWTVNCQYPDFKITMHCYLCHFDHSKPTLLEHSDACWAGIHDISSLDWLPADIAVVEALKEERIVWA